MSTRRLEQWNPAFEHTKRKQQGDGSVGRSQDISAAASTTAASPDRRLSRYQWLTLISAFLGWMFDSMDLNLFTLVLVPSVGQLPHSTHAGGIGRVGGWGGLTFLQSRTHQLSATMADHRDVAGTVGYAFILLMASATLGYLTLIWMLEALGRRMSHFIFSLGAWPLGSPMAPDTRRRATRLRPAARKCAERLAFVQVDGTHFDY
jgi:hypothetical protein